MNKTIFSQAKLLCRSFVVDHSQLKGFLIRGLNYNNNSVLASKIGSNAGRRKTGVSKKKVVDEARPIG